MIRTSEQRTLLQAIARNPDDDTVRLGYADYLDEYLEGDNGQAEYIRKSIEIVRSEPSGKGFQAVAEWNEKVKRCRELWGLCSNSWNYEYVCPTCAGRRVVSKHVIEPIIAKMIIDPEVTPLTFETKYEFCPTCMGTGSLLTIRRNATISINDAVYGILRTVRWDRGFIDSISCAEQEVISLGDKAIVASDWARKIVEMYPVTKFVIDRWMPQMVSKTLWRWRAGEIPAHNYHQDMGRLPEWLIELMMRLPIAPTYKAYYLSTGIQYTTREHALDHLSRAINHHIRKRVYGG